MSSRYLELKMSGNFSELQLFIENLFEDTLSIIHYKYPMNPQGHNN